MRGSAGPNSSPPQTAPIAHAVRLLEHAPLEGGPRARPLVVRIGAARGEAVVVVAVRAAVLVVVDAVLALGLEATDAQHVVADRVDVRALDHERHGLALRDVGDDLGVRHALVEVVAARELAARAAPLPEREHGVDRGALGREAEAARPRRGPPERGVLDGHAAARRAPGVGVAVAHADRAAAALVRVDPADVDRALDRIAGRAVRGAIDHRQVVEGTIGVAAHEADGESEEEGPPHDGEA